MQRAILRIQWKACWHLVLALSLAALALPIVSVRLGWQGVHGNLPEFLTELQLWGFFYPVLAAVSAIILAAGIWASDRRGQHVYAMLLPVPRWRYVWYRYAAGLLFVAVITVALGTGAVLATAGMPLPPGTRTFPLALTAKFVLALALLYGLAFAFASASARVIGIALRLVGLFLVVHIAVLLLHPGTNLLWKTMTVLAVPPGPLAVLGGRWMLIDV